MKKVFMKKGIYTTLSLSWSAREPDMEPPDRGLESIQANTKHLATMYFPTNKTQVIDEISMVENW